MLCARAAVAAAAREVALFVGARPCDLVPVQNATTAVNTVVRAAGLGRGDVVLLFNTTYPAVSPTDAYPDVLP